MTSKGGEKIAADHALSAAPSIFFDALVLLFGDGAGAALSKEAAAVDWVRDAFGHLKVIGGTAGVAPLFEKAAIAKDEGVIDLATSKDLTKFVDKAKEGRIWERELTLRSPG